MLTANSFENALRKIADWAIAMGLQLLSAALILFVGWWIIRILVKALRNVLGRSKIDEGATGFICSVIRAIMWIVIVITALGQLDININSMIAALGAAGLTASFALQGSLGNFVSGMQVIFSKPFGVGDFLSVDNNMGSVKEINVLNTVLTTPDNKEIVIPNSIITSGIVINYSSQKYRRLDLVYSISYDTDIQKPKNILATIIEKNERIELDPPPIIAVGELTASCVQIVAKVWCEADFYWDVYYEMQEEVKLAFDENNITFPFPQMDVHNK